MWIAFSTRLGPINQLATLSASPAVLSSFLKSPCEDDSLALHLSVLPSSIAIGSSPCAFLPIFQRSSQSQCRHAFASSTFYFPSLSFLSYASKEPLSQVIPTSSSIGLSPTSLLLHLELNRRFLLFFFFCNFQIASQEL